MKTKYLISAVAGLLLLAGSVNATSLILNGTFTQTTLSGSNYFTATNILSDWTVSTSTTNFVYFQAASPHGLDATISQGGTDTFTIYNSATGTAGNPGGTCCTNSNVVDVQAKTTAAGITGNVIVADGGSGYQSSFSQTVTGLTIGKTYTLTFEQAAGQQAGFGCQGGSYPASACTTEQWQVTWAQTNGTNSQTQTSALMTNPLGGFQDWNAVTMYFTATNASEVLTFLSDGQPGGTYPPVALLADVSLQTGAPEPATLAIMGVGLLALGLATRLKKRT